MREPRRPLVDAIPEPTATKRVKGIEPSYSAWKAAALPLSYTRETNKIEPFEMGGVGFEPT